MSQVEPIQGHGTHRQPSRERRDARFEQLLELAEAGDQNAVADLFREFHFKFGEDRP